MKKTIILIVLILFGVAKVFADNSFTATASTTNAQVGEQIQITFTLNTTSGKNFQPPSFKGFTVLAGPSRSMSTQIINGQISSSLSFIYILSADVPGTYTIEPAKITVDGRVIHSNPITITVSKSATQNTSKQPSTEKSLGEQANEIIRNNLFIRLAVDKNQAYLGETIVATYKLYVHPNLNIVNISVPKMPSFNGFWTQDFGIKELKFTTENINGVPYRVADLKQVVLIPQQVGNLSIDPMEIEFVVRLLVQQQRKRSRDPFDMLFDDPFFNDPFFSNRYKDFPYTVKSKPTSIKVLPLPTNQPSDFHGGVGSMQMKAWLDKNQVKTGEVATLRVQIAGKGNLKLLSPFNLSLPNDFDVYEPKLIDNTNVSPSGISGNVVFEYYLIPKNPGEFRLDPIRFAYFDLSRKEYVTLVSEPFSLKVEKGVGTQSFVAGVKKEDVKLIGQDIRYIKTTSPGFLKGGTTLWGSPTFVLLSVLPVGLWFVFFVYLRRKRQLEGNIVLLRQKRAKTIARKHLATAKKFMSDGKKEQFYEETARALWGFVANKLNILPTDLTKETIQTRLVELGLSAEEVEQLINVINFCEQARYSPLGNNQPLEMVYSNAVEVLSNLGEKLI
jgi:hypothetical protein